MLSNGIIDAEEHGAQAGDRERAEAGRHAEAHQDEQNRDVASVLDRRAEADDAGGAGDAEGAGDRAADDDHHHRAGDAEQHLRLIERGIGGLVVRYCRWTTVTSMPITAAETSLTSSKSGLMPTGVSALAAAWLNCSAPLAAAPLMASNPKFGHLSPTATSPSPTAATPRPVRIRVPGNRLGLRFDQRIDDFEHGAQVRQVQQLLDARVGLDQREAALQALRRGVAADEGANAGAVGGRHAPQIDHDVCVAGSEKVLNASFELFGGTAGDERFLRGEEQSVGGAFP